MGQAAELRAGVAGHGAASRTGWYLTHRLDGRPARRLHQPGRGRRVLDQKRQRCALARETGGEGGAGDLLSRHLVAVVCPIAGGRRGSGARRCRRRQRRPTGWTGGFPVRPLGGAAR
ncbi:hypothetical protein KCH_76290 [Kitasatospora cheerisanensis KCTC 2395]|uniref:Uncharacterized protein n=1 Tax=Kitasatospora cheerisanensis KCTC 2395 TaxID=1348663 RepID=A0A066YRL5_9ACTN|nr:hypothetical protein KCH_76290 [Kitasatospora cheerisanensis KCTC 2395]